MTTTTPTTVSLQNIQHKPATAGYNYGGIPIFCTGGIHESIFDAFKKRNKSKSCSILVLGSGAGAFEQRLLADGYTNITSVEFVAENFLVKGTKFLSLDLNEDFSNLGTFDAIFAIELIEHLENQFHFIRCVKKLLDSDGFFYLSTPSIENTFARIKFFALGRLQWFGISELGKTGHISPILNHILRFNLEQSNLVIKKHFANANIWSKALQHRNLFVKIIYFVSLLISFALPNKDTTEINLFEIAHA